MQPTERDEPRVTAPIAREVYVCCGLISAAVSMPALFERGYPPIDPGWHAATLLWVAAIPLSIVFDGRPFSKRFRGLAVYCLVTAFFDANSGPSVVPRNVTVPVILLMGVLLGPIHLAIGLLVEGLSQGTRAIVRSMFKRLSAGPTRVMQWVTFVGLVALTSAFPFVFRAHWNTDLRNRGRAQAEEDWNAGRAELHVEWFNPWNEVTHYFDPATGLKIRQKAHLFKHPYSLGYQARVAELLAEYGIPEWSMKKYIPADDDLLAMLDSKQMEKIDAFPHEVNENIILFRRGTVTRWNTTFSNSGGFLAIATPQGLIDMGTSSGSTRIGDSHVELRCGGAPMDGRSENEPVFIGRLTKYPRVIFIRSGSDWVGAFHESGWWLSYAHRGEASFPSLNER